MKTRLLVTTVAALALAASASAATLTVSPVSGKRGSYVTVRGTGFPARRAGAIAFAGRRFAIRTTPAGIFASSLRVPRRARIGAKRLAAQVGASRIVAGFRVVRRGGLASSTLVVASGGHRVLVSPTAAEPGRTVLVRGSRFTRRRGVRILFGRSLVARARTNRAGAFSARFTVPARARGTRQITVRAGGRIVRTLFAVRRACGAGAVVCLPYGLEFDRPRGGLRTASGVGTGFTYVAPVRRGKSFLPGFVTVDTSPPGTLRIRTTAGIAYLTNNMQHNALAVGLQGAKQVSVVHTTLLNPPPGTRHFEQGGLWFGTNQDNYVKLVVISHQMGGTRIQHLLEVGGALRNRLITPVMDLSSARVELTLRADPTTLTVSASYRVNGRQGQLGTFAVPADFFSLNATGTNPRAGTKTFAGIFASHRRAATSLFYTFDDFSVTAG